MSTEAPKLAIFSHCKMALPQSISVEFRQWRPRWPPILTIHECHLYEGVAVYTGATFGMSTEAPLLAICIHCTKAPPHNGSGILHWRHMWDDDRGAPTDHMYLLYTGATPGREINLKLAPPAVRLQWRSYWPPLRWPSLLNIQAS